MHLPQNSQRNESAKECRAQQRRPADAGNFHLYLSRPGWHLQSVSMTQKDIRDLIHFQPFKPFRLRLADGKDLPIPHPDFALVAADYLVVAAVLPGGVPGDINLVPYAHIVRVEMLPRKGGKAV
jgi:hypothetical protein